MRNLTVAAVAVTLAACNLASAQVRGDGHARTEARTVGAFSSVSAGGALHVTIRFGTPAAVTVTADANIVPLIRTRVQGDRLIVDSTGGFAPKTPVEVAITVPSLTALEVSGASAAEAHGLAADAFAVEVSGASTARLDGTVAALTVEASGAGNLDAGRLAVTDATVAASGASHVELRVAHGLTAAASGAAEIRYQGKPSVTRDVSGAASVKPR